MPSLHTMLEPVQSNGHTASLPDTQTDDNKLQQSQQLPMQRTPSAMSVDSLDSDPTAGMKRSSDAMDQDTESEEKRKRRTGSPAGTLPTINEAHRRKRSSRSSAQPRWHNQAYMLFLALRESPNRSLPRKQLIDGALEMDKRISKDRGLPKVFKGKVWIIIIMVPYE